MRKKKTHEEYVAEVAIINPNIEVVGTYINSKTPILYRCKIDGHEWTTVPTNVLRGSGCPKCSGNIKKTHEQYVEELATKNPTVEVIGRYIDAKTKITYRCLIHDVYWDAFPYAPLRGHGCPMCHSEKIRRFKMKSHEQYVEELKNANSNIVAIEEYKGIDTPILHKCLKHNVTWRANPWNVLVGSGCCECIAEKARNMFAKTHEQYVEELCNINKNIVVLERYINNNTPLLHKCLVCGNEWNTKPMNTLSGCGCPKCNKSRGEREVSFWLENRNIDYIFQKIFEDCKDKSFLPFDFYLPDYNVCIEYNGKQHYELIEYFGGEEKFKLQQKHDNIKREYCKNNNIRLLEIPYFKNIEEELNNFLFI